MKKFGNETETLCSTVDRTIIDDTAKGGLTIFWELFTVIPYPPKHLNVDKGECGKL